MLAVRHRARRRIGILLLGVVAPLAAASPDELGLTFSFAPHDPAQAADAAGVRVLGALALRSTLAGRPVPRELSGLAWSEDDGLLYAVSDAGWLLHLEPRFAGDTLQGVRLVATHRLSDSRGQPLARRDADAEGLALRDAADGVAGNTRLLISFEGEPVVAEHAPDGRRRITLPLPDALNDLARYEGRNHGLEALAWHPLHGLVTAPEKPLRGDSRRAIMLYAGDGRRWPYPVEDIATQSITGLDTLPDGSLLAIERRYANPWLPVVCTLSVLTPDGDALRIRRLASFSSARGWPVDNFEAVAHYRGQRFFVVSDDNESPLQRSLLILFEIREERAP
jgi:hypothetical protein